MTYPEAALPKRAQASGAQPPQKDGLELQAWTEKLKSIGATLTEEAVKGWGAINEQLHEQSVEKQDENAAQIDDLDLLVAGFQQSLASMTEQTESVQNQVASSMSESAQSLQEYCSALERGLTGLNDVLEKLGQRQVVVQAEPRRRWFFRRRNGD